MRHGSQYRVMHVCRSLGGVSCLSEQADYRMMAHYLPPLHKALLQMHILVQFPSELFDFTESSLFDSKWVIRSFIKDRLHHFNDSFADLLFNPLFRSGYSSRRCYFSLKHINAKRPSWRKRCPWQSKYRHLYYAFIKFSFSPSKVTKIFLSLSSSFSNFIVLFVLLVLIHIIAVITITYVKIIG